MLLFTPFFRSLTMNTEEPKKSEIFGPIGENRHKYLKCFRKCMKIISFRVHVFWIAQEIQRGAQMGVSENVFGSGRPSIKRNEVHFERVRQVVYGRCRFTALITASQLDLKNKTVGRLLLKIYLYGKITGLGELRIQLILAKMNIAVLKQALHSHNLPCDFFPKLKEFVTWSAFYRRTINQGSRKNGAEEHSPPKRTFQQCREAYQRRIEKSIRLKGGLFEEKTLEFVVWSWCHKQVI